MPAGIHLGGSGLNFTSKILVLYAHPYPRHSRATKALLNAVRDLPGLEVRSLYDLYPDFDIDVSAEQAALIRADLVIAEQFANDRRQFEKEHSSKGWHRDDVGK